MTPDAYKGRDLGPYRRFQKRRFYGGCYSVDTMYCNWTCDNCWSKFGWRTLPPAWELTSDEVVARTLRGMRRNELDQGRVTGGEPTLLWHDHMQLVVAKFLVETKGEKIAGEAPFLVLETNGSLLTPRVLAPFERRLGDEADRFQLTVGMKATSIDQLMQLTGLKRGTAERFHRRQLSLIDWLAQPERKIVLNVVLLDAYCTDEAIDELADRLEAICEGNADAIDIQEFKTGSWGSAKYTEKHYKAKRHRGESP